MCVFLVEYHPNLWYSEKPEFMRVASHALIRHLGSGTLEDNLPKQEGLRFRMVGPEIQPQENKC